MKRRPKSIPLSRQLYLQTAAWTRWIHIYLSMISFSAMMFFAVTGITLNHPAWFTSSEPRTSTIKGSLSDNLLTPQPDQLQVAEELRARHKLRGKVDGFQTDEYECMVVFKGPGYSADIFIDRETGKYDGDISASGIVAVMNDLHKGRDSGAAWSWVIDVSAVLSIVVSVSGFGLLLFLKRKRTVGLISAVAGTAALLGVWGWFVY